MTAILLCAGLSERMGRQKLNLELDGKPLYTHAVDYIASSAPARFIIVASRELEEIERICELNNAELIFNDEREKGLSHSFSLALSEIEPDGGGVSLFLADKPFITVETIRRIYEIYEQNQDCFIRPFSNGVPGHPVVFSSDWLKHTFFRENGMKSTMKRFPDRVIEVEIPEISVFDIDTPQDYQKALVINKFK